MKTIIAGSRSITNPRHLDRAIRESLFTITEVVSGHCRGVDLLGERWADEHHLPLAVSHANWKLGPKAGPLRNAQMATYAEALVLVWDGKSRGSADMLRQAEQRNLAVFVYVPEPTTPHGLPVSVYLPEDQP